MHGQGSFSSTDKHKYHCMQKSHQACGSRGLIQHIAVSFAGGEVMSRSLDCTWVLRLPVLQSAVLQHADSTDTGHQSTEPCRRPCCCCWCHRASVPETTQINSHNSCAEVTQNLKPICHKQLITPAIYSGTNTWLTAKTLFGNPAQTHICVSQLSCTRS